MATLTGNAINTSYQGLIKTTDNGAIGGTEKRITDGLGNASTITLGTGGVSFDSGTVDFTGATVSGLPAGVDSIIAGTGMFVNIPIHIVLLASLAQLEYYALCPQQIKFKFELI